MTRWFIPNPASVSPGVLAAQVTPPSVGTLLQPSVVSERLREYFFPSFQPPVFFSCTREGLLQMAVEWFSDRKIIMIVNGPMSQEWYDISDDCRGDTEIFDAGYGTEVDADAFRLALQKEKFDLLMFVETDVYTASRSDPEPFCAVFREQCPDGLIAADISGSVFTGMDAGTSRCADICFCASEIALGLPPGLGIAVLNERAHTRLLAHNLMNGRYFNYSRQTVSRSPSAADAPVYTLLNALNEQIDEILTEGMDERTKRMFEVRGLVWQWIAARGFTVLSSAETAAMNCTAIELPADISAQEMSDFAARYGVFVMTGVGLMPKNSLILYHGNDARPEDAAALVKTLDRFLADYDTRRRHAPRAQKPQEQKV